MLFAPVFCPTTKSVKPLESEAVGKGTVNACEPLKRTLLPAPPPLNVAAVRPLGLALTVALYPFPLRSFQLVMVLPLSEIEEATDASSRTSKLLVTGKLGPPASCSVPPLTIVGPL